jgi:hypothetical protein
MDSFAASYELGHGKVEIFPSTIPHAGYGLRALVFIPAFDPCSQSVATLERGFLPSVQRVIVSPLNTAWNSTKWTIDAVKETSCFGRYVNDPLNLDRVNVCFLKHPTRIKILLSNVCTGGY